MPSFDIQRREDGGTWTTIATVDDTDYTESNDEYTWYDEHDFEYGVNYEYRVQETEEQEWSNVEGFVWDVKKETRVFENYSETSDSLAEFVRKGVRAFENYADTSVNLFKSVKKVFREFKNYGTESINRAIFTRKGFREFQNYAKQSYNQFTGIRKTFRTFSNYADTSVNLVIFRDIKMTSFVDPSLIGLMGSIGDVFSVINSWGEEGLVSLFSLTPEMDSTSFVQGELGIVGLVAFFTPPHVWHSYNDPAVVGLWPLFEEVSTSSNVDSLMGQVKPLPLIANFEDVKSYPQGELGLVDLWALLDESVSVTDLEGELVFIDLIAFEGDAFSRVSPITELGHVSLESLLADTDSKSFVDAVFVQAGLHALIADLENVVSYPKTELGQMGIYGTMPDLYNVSNVDGNLGVVHLFGQEALFLLDILADVEPIPLALIARRGKGSVPTGILMRGRFYTKGRG